MHKRDIALVVMVFLAWLAPRNLTSASPQQYEFEIAFCNFDLAAGVKQANASFYVSYSFIVDGEGRPTNITKLRNDYVDEKNVTSCLGEWRFRGVQKGAGVVALFRWQHAEGWVDVSISGPNFSEKIKLTGDRCPYSEFQSKPGVHKQ